jgi:hypothetical protein
MASPDTAKPATARTVNGLQEDRLRSSIILANIRAGLPRQAAQRRRSSDVLIAAIAPPRTVAAGRAR